MTNAIKAVVFDWAGTMVDFGCCAPVKALQSVFTANGVTTSESEVRRDMGMAKRAHIAALLAMPQIESQWSARFGGLPTSDDVKRLHDAVEPLMVSAAADCADLIPGAADVVAMLRARGIKIGSCTGYTRTMIDSILPRAAAQGYAPDAVVCSGETSEGRPSPLMLWKLLVELGVWPALACIKVDDAPVGIFEGRHAGCWTVGVAASGNGVGLSISDFAALTPPDREVRMAASRAALQAAGADLVIDSVAEFGAVLAEIEGRIAAGERPSGRTAND
ncbi:MAG: phosphonoacetaldehyde hydrolase [Sphingomonadaceae bacterium]